MGYSFKEEYLRHYYFNSKSHFSGDRFSIVGDGLFSFKCILNLYWNNYFNYKYNNNNYNNYFNSGRYFISGCNVMFSLKCTLNHYWNNYFNSGRYFNSGCDVKLSLKFILNHYWNNYFNSGRYFNSGCNTANAVTVFIANPRGVKLNAV